MKARKHTLIALVENRPGVLNRVASLFRRRAFNIDSLTVGHTDVDRRLAHDHGRGGHRAGPTAQHRGGATSASWSTSST